MRVVPLPELAELFAGDSCEQIAACFGECGLNDLCGVGSRTLPEEFSAQALYDRCAVPLYLGVRYD